MGLMLTLKSAAETTTRDMVPGALAALFRHSRKLQENLQADQRMGCISEPAFLHGGIRDSESAYILIDSIERQYPLALRSPFEGVESIAGGIWRGSEVFGDNSDDAIVKLRFEAGTMDLPLHVHEHSGRCIVVASGSGRFHWSDEPMDQFTGMNVKSVEVKKHDALLFTPNLLHTFSVPDEPLVLLSYQSPFIELDDPRQWALPKIRWTARSPTVH
jgi:mannose-6-phosphate isomerase-like protein (cupin superfamily)